MVKDLFSYLWKERLWWMLPPIVVFLLFGALVAISNIAPVSPFMYMLF